MSKDDIDRYCHNLLYSFWRHDEIIMIVCMNFAWNDGVWCKKLLCKGLLIAQCSCLLFQHAEREREYRWTQLHHLCVMATVCFPNESEQDWKQHNLSRQLDDEWKESQQPQKKGGRLRCDHFTMVLQYNEKFQITDQTIHGTNYDACTTSFTTGFE